MSSRTFILGVPVDAITLSGAVMRLEKMAAGVAQHHVVTPNPEMLVAARSDPAFHAVLERASLAVPDGVGLLLAARYLGAPLLERVAGIDLLTSFCAQTRASVFFLGAAEGVAGRAVEALRSSYPTLHVAGTYAGSARKEDEEEILARIRGSGASVLFVAYGAPAQDLWIARMLPRLPHIKVAMGVGGSFDFLAGVQRRAPLWMRRLGLEWLWRLLAEPRRIGRICRAVLHFPLLISKHQTYSFLVHGHADLPKNQNSLWVVRSNI